MLPTHLAGQISPFLEGPGYLARTSRPAHLGGPDPRHQHHPTGPGAEAAEPPGAAYAAPLHQCRHGLSQHTELHQLVVFGRSMRSAAWDYAESISSALLDTPRGGASAMPATPECFHEYQRQARQKQPRRYQVPHRLSSRSAATHLGWLPSLVAVCEPWCWVADRPSWSNRKCDQGDRVRANNILDEN